jgi:glutamyl-tRNA reductase
MFYNVDEKFYRRLITTNPFIVFNILHTLYSQNKISDQDEFEKLINKIARSSKETKQTIQNETKNNLPQIIENLKQKQNDENAKFLLKLANYLQYLLKKEKRKPNL